MLRNLARRIFSGGYSSSHPTLQGGLDIMGSGSSNVLVTGTGKTQIWKGLSSALGSGATKGAKVMMNVGDSYGGLGDHSETGRGSIFRVLGSVFFIGQGTLYYNGADTGGDATTTLSLRLISSGAINGTTYQAGSAEPSAPSVSVVTPPTGYTGKNNGVVTVKIARVRSTTGAESNASPTSAVVSPVNESVAVTFPSADSNGQDYWSVYCTKNAEGGIGNHYFLQEIAESTIAETVTATGDTINASTAVDVPNGTLDSSHLGWEFGIYQVETNTVAVTTVTAGNARSVVTAAGMSGSPVTVTVPLVGGETANEVATKFRTALAADSTVGSFFTVGGTGADITLTTNAFAATDGTMNFTIEDVTSSGITDSVTSTTTYPGEAATYVTSVGADDSGGAGQQRIGLNAAPAGTDSSQPVVFTRAVAGTTRTYVFEWRDSDLDFDLAPIRNYPPPAGVFGGVIEDVVFVDGCYGESANVVGQKEGSLWDSSTLDGATPDSNNIGNAIAVSDPLKPESFPPDNYLFTGDAPTCLLAGSNGVYWRFAQNSLGVIRYIGGSPALSYERIWTGVGVLNQNNACLGQGGRVYAYTADRGAVRMGGDGMPDTMFAAPVAEDMASWTASDVVLGFDGDLQLVLFMHQQTILAYYEPMGIWCAPLTVTSSMVGSGTDYIRSVVTVNGQAYLAFGDASDIDVYTLNAGAGTTGTVQTPWIKSEMISSVVSRINIAMRRDAPEADVNVNVYANGSGTTRRTFTLAPNTTGFQHLPVLKPNVRNAKSFRVKIDYTSAGGDAGFDMIELEGEDSNITW